MRDLKNLTVAMPNVAMDDIGTSRGVANFSIRGLGINSSIPSVEPAVGLFIDGVYMGVNAGTVFDLLDVRGADEFEAGHLPASRHAPGGQLVQGTDQWVAVRGARIVLAGGARPPRLSR